MAAECALKAILVGYLGGKMDPRGRPTHPDTAEQYGHLPNLWVQVGALMEGRAGAQFAELLLGSNPFESWQIYERYCADDHIDVERAARHLRGAKQLIATYERAQLDGLLS